MKFVDNKLLILLEKNMKRVLGLEKFDELPCTNDGNLFLSDRMHRAINTMNQVSLKLFDKPIEMISSEKRISLIKKVLTSYFSRIDL